jgi:heme/copper-type cytochrome/quinol oxidase subunit 4
MNRTGVDNAGAAQGSLRWNVLALVITLLIMVLFVGLTLWIVSNLKYRMM